LNAIKGTGEFGRIREADVRAVAAVKPVVPPPPRPSEDRSAATARRRIAERMEESVRTIPSFTLRRELDASALIALRDQLLPVVEARTGARLSFTDFLIKAMAEALRDVPEMNAWWREDRLERRTKINVAFAAQAPTRLLTPVVADADQLSLAQLARRRAELATQVREGRLALADLEGASCSLSNLGPFGIDEFDAIINPPESCILAAGRIIPRPFVVDGQLVARPTLRLTLTVDHRVADGVLASRFLAAVAKTIEQPLLLLV
jgi:pyruvate dehydrogenase E2 component (dihydrolipoamide acetyltransferase)